MTPYECPRTDNPCGQMHRGCSAHSKRHGGPCGAQPLRYVVDPPRCRSHLGRPLVAVRAEQGIQRQARRLVQVTDSSPVDVDAVLHEHLALAGEALQWKNILAGIVAELTSVGYESRAGEQTKSAVRLYGESMDRLDRILTNVSRLGIESRLAAVSEAAEVRLRAVLMVALRQLGHDLADAEVVRAVQAGIAATEVRSVIR